MGMVKKVTFFSLLLAAILGAVDKISGKKHLKLFCRKKESFPEKMMKTFHNMTKGMGKKQKRPVFMFGR
ncbi:MAG TPA: hypothetical protein PLE24_13675 [Chitinispirillaceae bacterium]|jgi:hypothetical protein|nr:hypothetical protein [Chitinispirillaceae bacterium]